MRHFSVDEIEVETTLSRRHSTRLKSRFLKGPIPMTELWAAAQLPGQALALYIAIRHQCDISGSAIVALPAALMDRFGIGKDAKSRSLKYLCAAGLVSVQQKPGRSARVRLLNSLVMKER